ncbi:MAG TPA: DinB family protein [Flavitalea sp.]|nr:DinB family protein [Flavitalea sp.]
MQTNQQQPILTADELLNNWQGHRSLTRRVIEAFPEKELFEFSIGGMRSFADITKELLAIEAPGLKEMVTGKSNPLVEENDALKTKADLLNAWDEATGHINVYWKQITPEGFRRVFKLFGQYEAPAINSIFYAIDNEIHHRGQGYVYLRALGIEPPYFWEH